MTTEQEPIRVVSALELIGQRPEMFFDTDSALINQLIELVVEDVTTTSNSVEYRVEASEQFTVTAADVDWMRADRAAFEELWTRVVAPTKFRVNSHRCEILLAAVCDAVPTDGEHGSMAFAQNPPSPGAQMRAMAGKSGRWPAFRLSEPSDLGRVHGALP
ncbi:MAG: hypothetical protein M0D54_15950 [Hyphomonadaceae bacterium JAD_PAG50586_4]|nr:MAG: hypothetical protein M0D54_15950 [Hyphomonadaceae bacterium JAD_PAG50586_4]